MELNNTAKAEYKTRKQLFLDKIAGKDIAIPTPITREEYYLAKIAGEDVAVPVPISRLEKFYSDRAGLSSYNLAPITREDYYIAGATFEPISEDERFWFEINKAHDSRDLEAGE